MNRTIKATYEGGVLKPAEPLPLSEGETVEVTVQTTDASAATPPDREEIAGFLEELRNIPPDRPEPEDGLNGAIDHDKILYGGPNGAL
jgi:predicted DNA-binding antitoxin AbrB/MazE fold protein